MTNILIIAFLYQKFYIPKSKKTDDDKIISWNSFFVVYSTLIFKPAVAFIF